MDQPILGTLQCVVVTPERAVLDETVDFVSLPMYDGELGVMPGRAPLIGRLGYGELRIRHGTTTRRFFVDGGFAQVRSNAVTVLTPQAIRGEEIDVSAAEQALALPTEGAAPPEDAETQRNNRERARAQLRVAQHTRGETAG
jgi:F-type H+-transporting ATPase subunit epsilon